MSEINDISDHNSYQYKDSASDDLYEDIMNLIKDRADRHLVNPTDAVGVLTWAVVSIIIQNTDFGDSE
mgnify:CR=1 FL=1|jgi:hypothetical protein|tara:strand:- start:1949 stop:2152 length:204 start_codon:yes stop_codon:yes gene_type:complete